MMETVKEYERQTVNSGLAGDRTAALRAMVVHPLMGDYTTSQKCLDEMLNANRPICRNTNFSWEGVR